MRSRLFSFAFPLALGLSVVMAPAHAQGTSETRVDQASLADQPHVDGAALAVTITGLRDSLGGRVYVGLYDSDARFPEPNAQVRQARADVDGPTVRVAFEDLPPGRYAIAVFHDENGDAMFNQGVFGIPLEGFGFSRDAEVLFGSPSFDDAAFAVRAPETTQAFKMRYGL